MRLTARYRFAASHRLHTDALTPEENRALYGKCNYPFGHGHDYVLDVTVRGLPDESGQVERRDHLDRFVRSRVVDRLSHQDLNSTVPGLSGSVTTTENLARWIRDELAWDWPLQASLDRIYVSETDRNSFVLEANA